MGVVQAEFQEIYDRHFRVDRANPAAARQTLKHFWRPRGRLQSVNGGRHRDSRVFLVAAILTLESIYGRVILACYTGLAPRTRDRRVSADLRAKSLSIVPPTPREKKGEIETWREKKENDRMRKSDRQP
ncbi:hypothetical protein PoB_004122700 [Plakobranchus ocellatus]|uniref:DUF4817 domain-containing protein n=1 Tax=Plakobranchus ocellatus TaxID=259542 RepID=A0AAV4B5E4_9GAST|nr:hypothetical protein PoB_004122700 [Plakobranchus ocellatus]